MSYTIYTATGCTRCKIVKQYMDGRSVSYLEKDIKAEGKSDFQKFYKENRKFLFRGPDGIEFPILVNGDVIRQGLGGALAFAMAGPEMQSYFDFGILHGEWVDGVNISGGDPGRSREFLDVLKYLKTASYKVQAATDGRNPDVLATALKDGLIEKLIVSLPPSIEMAETVFPEGLDGLKETIAIALNAPDYLFETILIPRIDDSGQAIYPAPEGIGEIAQLVAEITGGNKHPFLLRRFDPKTADRAELKKIEPLPEPAMFKYRSKARRHLVLAEIEK